MLEDAEEFNENGEHLLEDWDIWEKCKFHVKEFVDLFMIMITAKNKIEATLKLRW